MCHSESARVSPHLVVIDQAPVVVPARTLSLEILAVAFLMPARPPMGRHQIPYPQCYAAENT